MKSLGHPPKEFDQNGFITPIRLDSSGNPTPDTWLASAATTAGINGYKNLKFLVSDSFAVNVGAASKNFMLASGDPVDFPQKVKRAKKPDNSADTFTHVTLNVYQVQSTTVNANDSISSQVQRASKTWANKIQGLKLDWDATAPTPIPACGGCTQGSPEDLTNFLYPTGCRSNVAWQSLVLRFPNAPGPLNTGIMNTGINIIFTNKITPDLLLSFFDTVEVVPLWNMDQVPCFTQKVFLHGNDAILSNQAFGNTLAHAIGHVFGLDHVTGPQAAGPEGPGNADGNNLMCPGATTFCPTISQLGTYLLPSQIQAARKGLQQWKK